MRQAYKLLLAKAAELFAPVPVPFAVSVDSNHQISHLKTPNKKKPASSIQKVIRLEDHLKSIDPR